MTPEEGRALFPVLERLAYLNAGTFGPIAQPTADAVRAQLDAELADGRFGKEYFERVLDLRKRARVALAGLVGAEPEQIALTGSTHRGRDPRRADALRCAARGPRGQGDP